MWYVGVGVHCGLIPARAGKTRAARPVPLVCWAHPRAGGENCDVAFVESHEPGSSPRGRGKPGCCGACGACCGLIPARAGKTPSHRRACLSRRAHPRAGGENHEGSEMRGACVGSSPRGRGKPRRDRDARRLRGLIPARAGKTTSGNTRPHARRAHPRAGGENHENVGDGKVVGGSSPRGRGKRLAVVIQEQRQGLIPARAGKTCKRGAERSAERAHPRAGGENHAAIDWVARSEGSSPRGRGKPPLMRGYLVLGRLIPARAGKTGSGAESTRRSTAHPRAGGENSITRIKSCTMPGSSPRGRGKPVESVGE